MDEETLWVLKKLSAREISARSADRILRALELLRKTEEGEEVGGPASEVRRDSQNAEAPPVTEEQTALAEMPQEVQQIIPTEEETEEVAEETLEGVFPAETEAEIEEELAEEVVAESEEEQEAIEMPVSAIHEAEPPMEEIEVTEPGEAEEEQIPSEVTSDEEQEEEKEEQRGIFISDEFERPAEESQESQEAIEEVVEEVEVAASEATIAEEEAPREQISEVPADSMSDRASFGQEAVETEGEVESQEVVLEAALTLEEEQEAVTEEVTPEGPAAAEESSQADTALAGISDEKSLLGYDDVGVIEDIPDGTEVILEKAAGNVTIRGWDQSNMRVEGVGSSSTVLREKGNLKIEGENDVALYIPSAIGKISIVNGSGLVSVEKYPSDIVIDSDTGDINIREVGGDMDVKSRGGSITIERSRGQNISAESSGGNLTLIDVVNNMNLRSESGKITVEGFSGEIRVKAENAEVFLKNSGDAQIHIESDDSNISIEDCYADVYVDSDKGNVQVSGGSLAFGGMGEVDLKMKVGDAYLHRRTFEDVSIAIEKGNAELDMEKLSSGGSGRISVDSGDITVKVLPSFRCEVIAQAPREKIHMELPIEVIEKDSDRLRGTLNGGGSKIELIAPDGEIRFQAL